MDTCMCVAVSLCCAPEAITTLLIGHIPVWNKKLKIIIGTFKKKKKEQTQFLKVTKNDEEENRQEFINKPRASGKESACQCRRRKRRRFTSWVRKILWRKKWQPASVSLPGESPRTEEPGGLLSMGQQSWTRLSAEQQLQLFARRKGASRPGSKSQISPWGVGGILRASCPRPVSWPSYAFGQCGGEMVPLKQQRVDRYVHFPWVATGIWEPSP